MRDPKYFLEKYPEFFNLEAVPNILNDFYFPRGWAQVIEDIFTRLRILWNPEAGPKPYVLQVKVKWGDLRFYVRWLEPMSGTELEGPIKETYDIIAWGEAQAGSECTNCGRTDILSTVETISPLCHKCFVLFQRAQLANEALPERDRRLTFELMEDLGVPCD